ncbi:MAG: UDP-N-acetylglucosamine 2-epimerase, partial [Paenibacillus sp.]|nr:UDP-N-acetylglucosamine 2-epimerase [Paenibacillus sp.]
TAEASIYAATARLLIDDTFYRSMSSAVNPFGDGQASRRIVQMIAHHFGFVSELPEPFHR